MLRTVKLLSLGTLWMLGAMLLAGCGTAAAPAIAPTATTPPATATARPPATPVVVSTATAIATYAVPVGTAIPATALAARVNGSPIYLTAYQTQRENYMRELWRLQRVDPMSVEGQRDLAQASPKLLEVLISRALVLQYAGAHHLLATDAEVQSAIAAAGGAVRLQTQLLAAHLSMQEYKDSITLTKTELAIVNSHSYVGATYHVRQILLGTKQEADAIEAQLRAHGDFAALAEAHSLDSSSRANGGDLGFQTELSLGPDLGPAVRKLPLNTPSAPISSPTGYHIVEVLNALQGVPPTGNALAQAKLQYWQQWYDALRQHASVQMFVKPQ